MKNVLTASSLALLASLAFMPVTQAADDMKKADAMAPAMDKAAAMQPAPQMTMPTPAATDKPMAPEGDAGMQAPAKPAKTM